MKPSKIILTVLAACLLAAPACSDDPPRDSGKVKLPAAAVPIKGDVAKVRDRKLFVEMLVNERPASRQCADLPVLLTVTFANPHPAMVLPLPGLGWLKPTIKAQDGNPDSADGKPLLEWKAPGLKTTSLAPGQSIRLTWVLQGDQPEGKYRMGLEGLDALVDKKESSVSGISLSPAILEIIPGRSDPAMTAYWERKVEAMTRGPEAWLASVEKALADDPENQSLRYEKVQALTSLGRPEKARHELAGLMLDARKKLSGKDTKKKVHLPYYLYQALADLHGRAAGKQTQ